MKVLVAGGRDYNKKEFLFKWLDELHEKHGITTVIQGEAQGADTLGRQWAESRRIAFESYPADWNTHGRGAGPIRNKQMLDEGKPDVVLTFEGGRGTENMMSQSRRAGVTVIEPDKTPVPDTLPGPSSRATRVKAPSRPDTMSRYERQALSVLNAEAKYGKTQTGKAFLRWVAIPPGNMYIPIKNEMRKNGVSWSPYPMEMEGTTLQRGGSGHFGMRFDIDRQGNVRAVMHPSYVPPEKITELRELGTELSVLDEQRLGGRQPGRVVPRNNKGMQYTQQRRDDRRLFERGLRELRRPGHGRDAVRYLNIIDPVSMKLEESLWFALKEQFSEDELRKMVLGGANLRDMYQRAHGIDTDRATKATQGAFRRTLNNRGLRHEDIEGVSDMMKHARGANIAAITNDIRPRDVPFNELSAALRYEMLRSFDMNLKGAYRPTSVMEAIESLSSGGGRSREMIEMFARRPDLAEVFEEAGTPRFAERMLAQQGPLGVPRKGPVLGEKMEGLILKQQVIDDARTRKMSKKREKTPRYERAPRGAYVDPVTTRGVGSNQMLSEMEVRAAENFDVRDFPEPRAPDDAVSVVEDRVKEMEFRVDEDTGKIVADVSLLEPDDRPMIQRTEEAARMRDADDIIREIEAIPNANRRREMYMHYRKLTDAKFGVFDETEARRVKAMINAKMRAGRKLRMGKNIPGIVLGLLAPTIAAGAIGAAAQSESA